MKRHKKWLDAPPKTPPTRAQFGLPEQYVVPKDQIGAANTLIEKEVNRIMLRDLGMNEGQQFELKFQLKQSMMSIWESLNQAPYPVGEGRKIEHTADAVFELMGRKLGMDDNFLELLNAEKRFQAAKKDWGSYQTWLKERNPERARMEAKHSMDTKNASHCVRLIRTGMEILTHKDIKVWREDAEELKSIRNGAWTYEQVLEYARTQKEKLEQMESDLPREANLKKLEPIVIEMIEEFNGIK